MQFARAFKRRPQSQRDPLTHQPPSEGEWLKTVKFPGKISDGLDDVKDLLPSVLRCSEVLRSLKKRSQALRPSNPTPPCTGISSYLKS